MRKLEGEDSSRKNERVLEIEQEGLEGRDELDETDEEGELERT